MTAGNVASLAQAIAPLTTKHRPSSEGNADVAFPSGGRGTATAVDEVLVQWL